LASTQAQGFSGASAIDGSVGCKAIGQPEKQLTVHFGIARQAEPAEQVTGVLDGSVVGPMMIPERIGWLLRLLSSLPRVRQRVWEDIFIK
jgi:hypothetical protein